MIPMSGPVLVVAAVVSSPALWATAVTGELPLDVALTRYLLVTGLCWVLLSVASELFPPAAPAGRQPVPVPEDDDPS